MNTIQFSTIEDALVDIRAGKMVVVVDAEDRENEGDLVLAAQFATPEAVNFMAKEGRGLICLALTPDRCEELGLDLLPAKNESTLGTAFTTTIEARDGVTTGISADDRARTIQVAVDPSSRPDDLVQPGHMFPLKAKPGGVLERTGHTEAAVDLARLAGLRPAGVLCEIVSEDDPTDMARGPELRRFADTHGLTMISIEQLISYRRRTESQVDRVVETRLPTEFGEFTVYGYLHAIDGTEFVALVAGDITGDGDVLVRVHSECLTGDVFGSRRCDCGPQLHESMRMVQEAGRGVIIYLRGHEGRGIGLMSKLKAYQLQDLGLDTVDANLEQGLPADAREYSAAGQILRDLGVRSLSLLTNNPTKCEALGGYGVEISGRTSVPVEPNEDNIRYLRTKRDRMGHDLPVVDDWDRTHQEGTSHE